jgi:hypothetical protein
MTHNIIGIIQEGGPMVCKKINCKWNLWHGEPNIRIGYKGIGGCTSEQKTFENNIKITSI